MCSARCCSRTGAMEEAEAEAAMAGAGAATLGAEAATVATGGEAEAEEEAILPTGRKKTEKAAQEKEIY